MLDLPKVLREVVLGTTETDKWTELKFNGGGELDILQDIKIVPHSGGHAFTGLPNRFIYWRANYDVLELVEQSLDINLCGNQVRYKFLRSPILNGISIHERGNKVEILIPTVSSVHRLKFPHPAYEKSLETQTASILSDVSVETLANPISNHIFSTLPHLPHAATSILTDEEDAIFCFALDNNSILQVRLQNLTGMVTTNTFRSDSTGRGLLSGLTGGLLGSKNDHNNYTISMTMEVKNGEVFLFALNRSGQLKVWCCNRLQCIEQRQMISPTLANFTGQNHILRKAWRGKNLKLVAYLSVMDKSQFVVMYPQIRDDMITFNSDQNIFSAPSKTDLIEMNVDCNGEVIWCIFRSLENGEIFMSALSIYTGQWTICMNEDKSTLLDNSFRLGLTAREYFLSLIFAPGVFSRADITRVISIYKGSLLEDIPEKKSDLRNMVCAIVDNEIQTEALEFELSDEDYIEISERCWNKFYASCVQYYETRKVPSNLFWLHSASLLMVTSKSGLSVYRNIETLEEARLCPESTTKKGQCYKQLLETIFNIEVPEEQNQKFVQALKGFSPLESVTAEIASEFQLENKMKMEINNLMKFSDLQLTLGQLSDILFLPETFEFTKDYFEAFRGEFGVKTIFSTIRDVVKNRLTVCRNLALLLELLKNSGLKKDFLDETLKLCSSYWIISWCCETIMVDNPQLVSLMHLLIVQPQISNQQQLLDCVWATLQHQWVLTSGSNLAEFLFNNKQYHLLQTYSRMVNHNSSKWDVLLIRCYLSMNEPYKAADLVEKNCVTPANYLKMIKLFEHLDHPDIVIHLAELAIHSADEFNNPDLPPLYSILFLNQLKLGHYNMAFVSLSKNPDRSRRVDCLRELVITLINSNMIDTLLNIPFNDLLSQLENIMEQRARSLQPDKAFIYYNFLYALHVKYDNFKKAARIMFEKGLRSEDNKQQMLSYATSVSCLALVSPENAWILKPKHQINDMDVDESDDEECLEILELEDLRREYELTLARNQLLHCPTDSSAQEVVLKLISAGRYRMALKISNLFKLKLEPALEALTAACARVQDDPDPWSWLVDNDVSDFVVGDNDAQVIAWRLLEGLLLGYEKPESTTLHKAVASKIMSLEIVIPYWLEISYKKRNPCELLRLYLKFGDLIDASKLCIDYIHGMLGSGRGEIFGLESSLCVSSQAMYLPVNAIDTLLHELEYHQLSDLHTEVKNLVTSYITTVEKVSVDRYKYLNVTIRS